MTTRERTNTACPCHGQWVKELGPPCPQFSLSLAKVERSHSPGYSPRPQWRTGADYPTSGIENPLNPAPLVPGMNFTLDELRVLHYVATTPKGNPPPSSKLEVALLLERGVPCLSVQYCRRILRTLPSEHAYHYEL